LGDDHDLGVLEGLLRADSNGYGGLNELKPLFRDIARRRGELRERARPIGEAVYPDNPKQFIKRIRALWHAWH
jgi:hypothetical protein